MCLTLQHRRRDRRGAGWRAAQKTVALNFWGQVHKLMLALEIITLTKKAHGRRKISHVALPQTIIKINLLIMK